MYHDECAQLKHLLKLVVHRLFEVLGLCLRELATRKVEYFFA